MCEYNGESETGLLEEALLFMPNRLSYRHYLLRYRIALVISIIFIVPAGYFVRFAGSGWLQDILGSVAYEIFWILLFGLFFPKVSPTRIAIGVFFATCVVEFLQLWQTPLLLAARSTLVGRLVLGNTFIWSDFISYFIGSIAGWIWIKCLRLPKV